MGKVIASLIVAVLILGAFCGFGYYKYKNPAELKTDVDLDDSSYDAESDTSTLTCDIEIKNPNYSFGRLVTEFSYIIRFKGSDGMTLHEVSVHPVGSIEKEDYEVELTFAPGGDYEAIKGKVAKAEVDIQSATFENVSRYRMAMGGEKYEMKMVWLIVYAICSYLFLFSFTIEILLPFDGGLFKSILHGITIVFLVSMGYTMFLTGVMPIIVGFLA